MPTRACEACVNYQPAGVVFRPGDAVHDAGEARQGQCRIGPPQPTAGVILAGRWPLVWADDWCGCFLARDGSGGLPPLRVVRDDDGGAA